MSWCLFVSAKTSGQVFGQLDFKIVVEPADAAAFTVVLLAPSRQEKAAWTSDISQVKYTHLTLRHEFLPSVLDLDSYPITTKTLNT